MARNRDRRKTLFDSIEPDPTRNLYCSLDDLGNEASVETFFVSRLLKDFGYRDDQIKTKESIDSLTVSLGRRKVKYRPDFILISGEEPRCVVDAKSTQEDLQKWVGQCASYCLELNRRFEGSNPVRYFVLTNGLKAQVFKWDNDKPLIELNFPDFIWGNLRFEHLKQILSPQSIKSPDTKVRTGPFALSRPTRQKARKLFATCHKIIWETEVCSPSAAFTEFVKVMFVKLWADKELRTKAPTKAMFEDEDRQSLKVPNSAVVFSVDWIERREAEGVKNPVDEILFAKLRKDIEKDVVRRRKKRIFDKEECINLKPDTLKEVVSRLQHYDMFGIDEDLNGRLFETFLNATMRGRGLGQFFTPRSIVKMMTRLAPLAVTPEKQTAVIDACCGSGGFLIEALTVMRNQIRNNKSLSSTERERLNEAVSNERLYGIDYGKNPPLARVARINMYLHGDGGSRIYYADALDKGIDPANVSDDPEVVQSLEELKVSLESTRFDVALTNPPFSMTRGMKKKTDRRILKGYELARKGSGFKPSLRSSEMFMERYWELLEADGYLITVLDDTVLASVKFYDFRCFLRKKFKIRAIISLPGDSFRRSGSRVKTSVLVLQKKASRKENQPSCFGYFSCFLGVDDLTPRVSAGKAKMAREKAEQETEEIVAQYGSYLRGDLKDGLLLDPGDLADRLDLKFCAPLLGRMASKWRKAGIAVEKLADLVEQIRCEVRPHDEPDKNFTLIKVSYDGKCEIDKVQSGKQIRSKKMYRVSQGDIVFSTIRSTDGAIGVVPKNLAGSLVSGSYTVLRCPSLEDTAYLWAVLRSHEIRADLQSLSPGSGRYTTYWDKAGEVLVPWKKASERRRIGKSILEVWNAESRLEQKRHKALEPIAELGVESPESIQRWKASKAPT